MTRIPLRRAEKGLYGLVREVCASGAPVVLTRGRIEVAALVPVGALALLAEARSLLARRASAAAEGLQEPDTGTPSAGPAAIPAGSPLPADGAHGRAPGAPVAPPGAPYPPGDRDVAAMAVSLSLTHDIPLAEARARIHAAIARGERGLEVP